MLGFWLLNETEFAVTSPVPPIVDPAVVVVRLRLFELTANEPSEILPPLLKDNAPRKFMVDDKLMEAGVATWMPKLPERRAGDMKFKELAPWAITVVFDELEIDTGVIEPKLSESKPAVLSEPVPPTVPPV